MRHLFAFAVCCLALAGAACSSAAHGPLRYAYQLFEDGKLQETLSELTRVETRGSDEPERLPEIAFLRGRCYEEQFKFHEAIEAYKHVLLHYPASPFAYSARNRVADLISKREKARR